MAQLGNTRKAYLTIGTSGTPTTWIGAEQSNSFNRTAEAIETSDKGSAWATFISGKKGATAEITAYTDDASNGQQYQALKALHQGSVVRVFIGTLSGSTASEGDAFNAIITAISDTNDNGAVASRSISLTATGEVTHYPTIS